MKHLLTAWPEISSRIRDARHVLLLLDYDGTLTPIVERPELANLSGNTRRILRALARQRGLILGIISGRALADLKNKVGVTGIIYAGNHGLEIEGSGVTFINPLAQELMPILRVIGEVLNRAMRTIKGVIVEDKGLTLSVHYRQAAEDKTHEVSQIFERIVGGTEAAGTIKVTHGKKVFEVRPSVAWDKGKAIRLLMTKYGKGGRNSGLLPIYLGDDLTDEDGFKIIEKYGNGVSVFVGEPTTTSAAGYFLNSPAEVEVFLRLLLESAAESE